jgi:hypothetical protein
LGGGGRSRVVTEQQGGGWLKESICYLEALEFGVV